MLLGGERLSARTVLWAAGVRRGRPGDHLQSLRDRGVLLLAGPFRDQPDASLRGLDRLRQYYNHPGFLDSMVDATLSALAFALGAATTLLAPAPAVTPTARSLPRWAAGTTATST